ncbi:MAG: hypothetical protein FWD76_02985 [Firmicutes bacterium]|nr:hypothetical protein [Bacillota bacterium]
MARWEIDNVGRMFVQSASKTWNAVFGFSCTTKHKVDRRALQLAVESLQKRQNYFFVCCKKGVSKNFFETTDSLLQIRSDTVPPCGFFALEKDTLVRVLYGEFRVCVEFFHGVTDGGGGLIFFEALMRAYFALRGVSGLESAMDTKNGSDKVYDEYLTHCENLASKPKQRTKMLSHLMATAYQLPFDKRQRYTLTQFVWDTKSLHDLSSRLGATVGVLLCSVLAYALTLYKRVHANKWQQNNIVINASIDLRKHKGFVSLQNAFASKFIDIKSLCKGSFFEMLDIVKNEFAKITPEYLDQFVCNLARCSRYGVHNALPRVVVDPFAKALYTLCGEKNATISFSNYGVVDWGDVLPLLVDSLDSYNGIAKVGRGLEVSCISFAGKTTMTLCHCGENLCILSLLQEVLDGLGLTTTVRQR